MSVTILTGDCVETMRALQAGTFQTCVTSPPYYGLRDYGVAGQIGLEDTPDAYCARLVDVFREVRRVLRDDGTLWLNLGDSYASNSAGGGAGQSLAALADRYAPNKKPRNPNRQDNGFVVHGSKRVPEGYKPKDLLLIPHMVAFALRADGWYLRSAIVWHKPNPMPESVRDRPTSAYEMVFLLTKAARYFYDAEAISEPYEGKPQNWTNRVIGKQGNADRNDGDRGGAVSREDAATGTRNARNVWTIATQPYSGEHFATMPPNLAERCIKAGSKPGDHVLDPFGGAGTTGLVADRLGRHATLCELNPAYADLARERITADAPLLGAVA